jgi:Immunoglobulin-like domain of bacterial spore germination
LQEEYYKGMKKTLYSIFVLLILASIGIVWFVSKKEVAVPVYVTTFLECAAAGNPIIETYPRQCRFGNQTFTEIIVHEATVTDLIHVTSPVSHQSISSPIVIEGEARGSWFFEASFPVVLVDWDGVIIAQGVATAQSDWMTTDFVPFKATLTFKNPTYKNTGALILKKDNPSGLPEHDNALEIPIIFATLDTQTQVPPATILPYNSGIQGTVLLGPTCPVMRNPPDPNCADKPYLTTVQVVRVGSSKSAPFATVETDKNGKYILMLPPGDYSVQAVGGTTLPRCASENITVRPGIVTLVTLSCDTGIR